MWFLFLSLMVLSGIGVLVFLILTIMKKKRAWIGLLASIGVGAFATIALIDSAIMAVPDASEPAVATSDSNEEVDKSSEDDSEKIIEVNEEYEVNGLNIVIEDIEITEKDVKISMNVKNESDNTKTFYPDQGDIVIGNKQIGANMFMTDGDVSGDIHTGVEKSGTLRFLDDDDELIPSEITEIELMLGNVFDEETYDSEDFKEVINVE